MAAYFNLNNHEISKEILVNKFNMILDNQGRLVLNDQKFLRHTMNHRDILGLFRSSRWRCSVRKGVLKNFANFMGKHLCWSLLQASNFIKKRPQHWCFHMKFAKFLRTSILKKICKRLLVFVSPQDTIANAMGEFGLDETLTECKLNFIKQNNLIFD